MPLLAKSDLSTGNSSHTSYLLCSGDLSLIFTAPYSPSPPPIGSPKPMIYLRPLVQSLSSFPLPPPPVSFPSGETETIGGSCWDWAFNELRQRNSSGLSVKYEIFMSSHMWFESLWIEIGDLGKEIEDFGKWEIGLIGGKEELQETIEEFAAIRIH